MRSLGCVMPRLCSSSCKDEFKQPRGSVYIIHKIYSKAVRTHPLQTKGGSTQPRSQTFVEHFIVIHPAIRDLETELAKMRHQVCRLQQRERRRRRRGGAARRGAICVGGGEPDAHATTIRSAEAQATLGSALL